MTSKRAGACALALASLGVGLAACDHCGAPKGERPSPPASASAPPVGEQRPPAELALSFIDALPNCVVDHRGPAIDLGTPMLRGRLGWAPRVPPDLASVEHGGATWTTVPRRNLDVDVDLLQASPVFVSMRIQAKAAKQVYVSIDGAGLGSLRLTPGEAKIVTTSTTSMPVDPGRHRISLRFFPNSRDDAYADIDWIRLGRPDEIEATYGAPTLADLVDPATSIGRVPHRSLVLRPPVAVRCSLRVPPQGKLRTAVGMVGEGRAEAEVRVLVDDAEPVSLVRREILGGAAAEWTELEASLDAYAGQLINLEIGSPAGATSGRLAFGEPEVVSPAVLPANLPKARGLIVLVLAGVETSDLPPWSGVVDNPFEMFASLGRRGTTYLRHRGSSTLDVANLATLLTGLAPETHGLIDGASRLPSEVTTLLETAQESQVRTAFITGVPTSFAPFGLTQGAAETIELSPVSGDDATAPIRAATSWLVRALTEEPQRRAVVVAHVRGGHPPWTPTAKQLEALAPTDYAGNLQPRRAAQQIAEIRGRRKQNVSPQDRLRMRALHTLAVSKHDAALGDALRSLDAAQLLDETMLVVTGDASSSVEQLFSPDLPLTERSLSLPLWILFPGGKLAGVSVRAPSEVVDLGATLFAALGLPRPASVRGDDLFALAAGKVTSASHPLLATMGNRFSSRWGDLVLHGTFDKAPSLCHLDLDPTCAFDRRPTMPLATSASFTAAVEELGRREVARSREPAALDDTTQAALTVWGL